MTDSTTGDLEQRVARAIAPFIQPLPYDELPSYRKAVTPRVEFGQADIDEIARAALKAIAEGGYAIFDKSCLDSPPAQQEDQHHD